MKGRQGKWGLSRCGSKPGQGEWFLSVYVVWRCFLDPSQRILAIIAALFRSESVLGFEASSIFLALAVCPSKNR